MEDLLQVGAISSSHGVHGEAKIYPMTDDINRFKKLKEVYLDTGKEMKLLHVIGVKFSKNMAILKFEEYTTPEEIDGLRRKGLFVTRENAVKLEKDEYFIADLIDMEVVTDEGDSLGHIVDVMQTGANDVYIVKTLDKKEILIPAIKDCILEVSMEKMQMQVHLLPGLLDEEV